MRSRLVAAVSVAVLALSVAALVEAVEVRLDVGEPRPAEGPSAGALLAGGRSTGRRSTVAAAPEATSTVRRPRPPRWRAVLEVLDRRRARAYAAGRAGLLRGVYVHGSPVMRRDAALLTHYVSRGLRVVGMRMRIADMSAERTGDDEAVLRLRERLSGAVVGRGVHRALRPGAPDRCVVVVLRRSTGQGWRIAAVRRA